MVSSLDHESSIERERSHRPRAHIRLMITLIVLGALAAGGVYGFQIWRRLIENWRAKTTLERVGMRVEWEPADPPANLTGTTRVDAPNAFNAASVSDADLALLRHLERVAFLDLSRCTRVTDDGLKELSALDSLQELTLGSTDGPGPSFTDDGLAFLESIPDLRTLSLANTVVSDQGLVHLKRLKKLEVLDLGNTAISDEGLAQIESLPRLSSLILEGTRVSAQAVQKLRRQRAALVIIHVLGDNSLENPEPSVP